MYCYWRHTHSSEGFCSLDISCAPILRFDSIMAAALLSYEASAVTFSLIIMSAKGRISDWLDDPGT